MSCGRRCAAARRADVAATANARSQVLSPPLSALLNHTLQVSDNLFAELVFKALALTLAPNASPMNYSYAVDVLRRNLPPAVAAGAFPVDGSGKKKPNERKRKRIIIIIDHHRRRQA